MPESSESMLRETFLMAASPTDQLEQAVREHSRALYAIAYSVLRNHHDAEEAVQESFVRFWRHRRRWMLVRNRRAWLARTAWRVSIDAVRSRRADKNSPVPLSEAAGAISKLRAAGIPADEIAAREEMNVLLDRLIESLPEALRHPLRLSLTDELSARQVAAVMGIPEGSVRHRLWEARQILKEKLSVLLEGNHERSE